MIVRVREDERQVAEAGARIDALEDAAAARVLDLLEQARAQVRDRLAHHGLSEDTQANQGALLRSMDAAVDRVRGQLTLGLRTDGVEAMQLGIAFAEATLPETAGAIYHLPNSFLRAVDQFFADQVTLITQDLRQQISRVIQVGSLSGQTTAEVAKGILGDGALPGGVFRTATTRALVIARTELQRVANIAGYDRGVFAASQLPGLQKEWHAAHDQRTRPDHRAADGQTVAMEDYFVVGGEQCRYPLDPMLSAGQSVHCRCRVVYQLPEGMPQATRTTVVVPRL